MAEAQLTMYEAAKQLVANETPMDPIILNKEVSKIAEQMYKYNYSMLLCHDRRDYTLFRLTEGAVPADLAKDLFECLNNRGQVLVIEEQPDGAWEIWIRDIATEENFAYYFFNYESGVVEV